MNAVSYSDLRKNLKIYMDQVYHNHVPLIITRKNNENIVIISINDYNSLTETQYLLSSETNAKRLQSSLNKARQGKGFKKDLIEE